MFLIDLPKNPGRTQQSVLRIQGAVTHKQSMAMNEISNEVSCIRSEEKKNFNMNHQEP